MTAHFLIDAWRFRCGVFRFTQFDLSLHSGKAWGTVVENLFRPSECVTDGGSFDSVRLTPHSAHDDSVFFDRRSSTCRSIPAKHGGPRLKISSGLRSAWQTWGRSAPVGVCLTLLTM